MALKPEVKKLYEEYVSKIATRPGVKELVGYLEKHGFLTAPASTKYHLCIEGGLVTHSVSVCSLALKLKSQLLPETDDGSVILCSLFHDAHKATDGFGNPSYVINEGYDKIRQPYTWNKDQLAFSGAHKSLLLVSKFVDLTKNEMQAIAYHDGPFVPSWEDIKSSPYPLTLLIHFSDMWSSWVIEKNAKTTAVDGHFTGNK